MVETRASKRKKPKNHVVFPSIPIEEDSDSIIPFFPHEISVEILSKLPVKSLLRFRSVSKSWLALISSSEFVKFHLNSATNDENYNHHKVILDFQVYLKECSLRSLFDNPITEPSKMDYPMRKYNFKWFSSANGLVCLAGSKKLAQSIRIDKKWPSSGLSFWIWNPAIRKSIKLPDSGVKAKYICSRSFRYGFGYDELHDDYKLVVIFNFFDDDPSYKSKIKIFSLKTHSWRTVRDYPEALIDSSAKFFMGKLYWTASLSIVSFDLANEKWHVMEKPEYGEGNFDLMLGVMGSDLGVLCEYESSYSDLWVMKDNGVEASWKKMCTINCPGEPGSPRSSTPSSPWFFPPVTPLFCQPDKGDKGEILLLYRKDFMIYNPKDDSIRQPKLPTKWSFVPEIFVESLVNPPR